jgi:gliding motility-associated-like protein
VHNNHVATIRFSKRFISSHPLNSAAMKYFTLIFGLFAFTSILNAQHSHSQIEHLFEDKSLHQVETILGLSEIDYQNQPLLDFIDTRYQEFHSAVYDRILSDQGITDEEFKTAFDAWVTDVQNGKLGVTPGGVPNETSAADGPCENMDFETGDLTGWTLTRGDVDGLGPYSFVNEFGVGPGPYHNIFGGGLDPVTGISRVDPLSGAFSVRLGNGTGVGARAARMKQTFLVDSSNFLFTYSYAVIFESPNGHGLNQLPYFTVRVIDSTGNSVPCGEYSVIADAANAPNYQTTNWGGTTVLFKDWETVFTNLIGYIGQNVTIEFTTGDCSLTGHFGYAYVDASCAVDQIIPSSTIICAGDSSLLSAPLGAASYLWSNGATTQTTWVSTGGTYSCTLTPFQGGGCSITLDVTIDENPSPTASFVSNTTTICVGDTIHFTDASTIPVPGLITGYRWDFGDGTISPIGTGSIAAVLNTTGTYLLPSHVYTVAGAYTVQLYVVSADGCADSIQFPVTINALPVVVAGIDQTVCEGTAVTLTGAGAVAYAWDNGVMDGFPFVQGVGTVTYTVIGTNANGCENLDQVDVIVNPQPVVSAGVDQEVCEGTLVTLSGSGALAYVWDNSVNDAVPFIQAPGTTTYTVIGTDANGCSNSDQVDVTVNSLPVVSAGPDFSNCENTQLVLNGAGAVTYAWDNGVTDGIGFVQLPGTTTYTVIGTDANGCVNTDEVDITINVLPAVVAGVDQTVCEGTAVTLTGAGATAYAWDNGVMDGFPFVQSVGTVTYTVIGTDANGCENSDQVDVTVNPQPLVSAGIDQEVCEGALVILLGSGATGYVWDNSVLDAVPFIQAPGTITYTVIGTDANGCSNSDQVDVTVNSLPVVSAGPDFAECENTQLVLTGGGAVTYAWDNGVTDGILFNQLPGTVTYTVTGTDANGCMNTDQVDVTVNALPIVVAGPDQEVCEGTPVTLNGSGATGYSWSGGVVDGVPFALGIGQYQFVVTGTDLLLCDNSDTVSVLVNPNPIVSAGMDESICDGELVVLNAFGSPNLYWSNGVINGTPFQQVVGIVDYVVYDSLATGCTANDTVRVEVLANPVVTANDAIICEGDEVVLEGQGAVSYSWTGGIQDGVAFFPLNSGIYTVTGIGANGCSSEADANVTVHKAPVVQFKISDMSLTTLNPVTGFENLTTGATTYEWNFGDGSAESNEFEPTHTFPTEQAGEYEIILTAYSAEGCPGQAIKYIHVFQDYTIYVPNSFTPDHNGVNEVFKPVMEGFDEDDFTLYIFNRWGDLIFESHDMQVGWDGTFARQDFQVQDGAYTWKIVAGLKDSSDSKIFVGHVVILK